MTYKHKVYGRVNGRYRTEIREETREAREAPTTFSENVPDYLARSFGVRRHRRGNP